MNTVFLLRFVQYFYRVRISCGLEVNYSPPDTSIHRGIKIIETLENATEVLACQEKTSVFNVDGNFHSVTRKSYREIPYSTLTVCKHELLAGYKVTIHFTH